MLKTFILLLFYILTVSADNVKTLEFTAEEKEWLAGKPELTFSEVNWQPLSFVSDTGSFTGMIADYMQIISEKSGIAFKYVPASQWADVLRKYDKKEIDVLPAVSRSDKTERDFITTKYYVSFPLVIVSRSNVVFVSETSELNGHRVGAGRGYTSAHFLKERYPDIKLVEVNDVDAGLELLKHKKIDFFVGHLGVLLFAIDKGNYTGLKVVGKTEFIFKHRMGIAPEYSQAVGIINKVFDSISRKEHNRIYNRWIVIYKSRADYSYLWKIGVPVFMLLLFLGYRHYALQRYNKMLKKVSEVDKLTQLYNRLKLDEVLEKEHYKANRYKSALSVILFDIDDFKSVNDMHGHQVGDQVLQEFSDIIRNTIRKSDIAGRWGGEEFLIISPHTNKSEASVVAEHVRQAVEEHIFLHHHQLTASFGIATYSEGDNIDILIGRADQALYTAKRNGKNLIID